MTERSASFESGSYAPAPLLVLRIDDELHGPLQAVSHTRCFRHSVDFAEKQRGETVIIHRAVPRVAVVEDEAVGLHPRQEKVDRLLHIRAVLAASRRIARRKKGHSGKSRDSDATAAAGHRAERSVAVILPSRQIRQAGIDRLLRLRCDQVLRRRLGRTVDLRIGKCRLGGEKQREEDRNETANDGIIAARCPDRARSERQSARRVVQPPERPSRLPAAARCSCRPAELRGVLGHLEYAWAQSALA